MDNFQKINETILLDGEGMAEPTLQAINDETTGRSEVVAVSEVLSILPSSEDIGRDLACCYCSRTCVDSDCIWIAMKEWYPEEPQESLLCDGCFFGFRREELHACETEQESILRARTMDIILMPEPLRGIYEQYSVRHPKTNQTHPTPVSYTHLTLPTT